MPIRTDYKDRLFCFVFGREENKEWTLSLYNAVNGSDIRNADEIDIETIDNFLYMGRKNDVAFIVHDVLNIYEHQSTYNPNMPLRELIYASKIYEKYVRKKKMNVFSETQLKLPVPKLVVFYNGKKNKDDRILKLSDAFENTGVEPDIEVRVRMININYGNRSNSGNRSDNSNSRDLLERCKVLGEYAWFVGKVREYSEAGGMMIEEAVDQALREMDKASALRGYLLNNKAEVIGMLFEEYNEKEHMDMVFAEGKEKGLKEGLKQGHKSGVDLEKQATVFRMLRHQMRDEEIIEIAEVDEETFKRLKGEYEAKCAAIS